MKERERERKGPTKKKKKKYTKRNTKNNKIIYLPHTYSVGDTEPGGAKYPGFELPEHSDKLSP